MQFMLSLPQKINETEMYLHGLTQHLLMMGEEGILALEASRLIFITTADTTHYLESL